MKQLAICTPAQWAEHGASIAAHCVVLANGNYICCIDTDRCEVPSSFEQLPGLLEHDRTIGSAHATALGLAATHTALDVLRHFNAIHPLFKP